jgi:hypothetical protein
MRLQAGRDQTALQKTYAVLQRVTFARTGQEHSPFRANALSVLEDVVTRPNAYRLVDSPRGVRLANRGRSGRSDELAVLAFDRAFNAQAHSLLEKAEAYQDVGRFSSSIDLPPTVNRRPQDEYLAKVAAETIIPKLIDQRPRIMEDKGAYWFANVRRTESLGEDAVALLTNAGQSQLKAAFLVQRIERADLLLAISQGRAMVEPVANGRGGIVNRLTHGDADLARCMTSFASDAEFALDAALAASTPRPPTIEARRHALLRAYQSAADDSDAGTALALCRMIERHAEKERILRQIGKNDAKRLDISKAHEAELHHIWVASQTRRAKPNAKAKRSAGHHKSYGKS